VGEGEKIKLFEQKAKAAAIFFILKERPWRGRRVRGSQQEGQDGQKEESERERPSSGKAPIGGGRRRGVG
jgi:hypothetical protein